MDDLVTTMSFARSHALMDSGGGAHAGRRPFQLPSGRRTGPLVFDHADGAMAASTWTATSTSITCWAWGR